MHATKKQDDAREAYESGFTCAASVFAAFSEELGLDRATARKIACGFGGGISRSGNICGAVSGALMVIGLKYGKAEKGDDEATKKTRALVREFMKRFAARHGSVNCTELLGYNLNDPEEYEKARSRGIFRTKCPVLVGDAAGVLEELLREKGE
jgi:C_GCAxxG_C_C family probable redox protein